MGETTMKTILFAAIGVTVLALSACAPSYYDRYDRYDRYGYYDRGYYDRDRDNDGVPNYADRSPRNPYRY